jgi:hypothetical protein
MTKNLEKADTVVKLTLAVSVIILYFMQVISGPFAQALTALSGLIVLIFVVKILYAVKHKSGSKP